jgi:hypothetical protein
LTLCRESLVEGRHTRARAAVVASLEMSTDPHARLAELLLQVERHRKAIREYGLAGYVTMVERHREQLESVYAEIREHCRSSRLPLPPDVPSE